MLSFWLINFLVVLTGILYGLCVLFLILYSSAQAFLLFKYIRYNRKKAANFTIANNYQLPTVTIQLPVYNEKYVIERLIDCVMKIDYPKNKLQIQVLDDSDDETSALITERVNLYRQKSFNICHVRRVERAGFKAGALKHGLENATGEFIAIFDADFLPEKDFLLKTIPHFQDPKAGMVQTRWEHINRNSSLLTDLQAFGLDAHFRVEQVGRNQGNCFINFNGTGGVWRKKCILDAGNWSADTLTEDLDLSYRAQLKGWKFIYLEDVAAPAELPPIMSALKSQQYRWTKGGAETARKHLKHVLGSKLPLLVKWQATAHLLNSAIFINVILCALLSVPVIFIKKYMPGNEFFSIAGYVFLASFFIIGVSYFVTCLYNHHDKWKGVFYFLKTFPLFISMALGLSLHHAIAVLEGYAGKKTPFIRTPKFNISTEKKFSNNHYADVKLSPLTIFEGLGAVFFLVAFYYSLHFHDYGMMVFHLMAALGFSMVFYHSISPGVSSRFKLK